MTLLSEDQAYAIHSVFKGIFHLLWEKSQGGLSTWTNRGRLLVLWGLKLIHRHSL